MAAKKSAVTQAVAEEREKAAQIDLRRQAQIRNQISIINRLADGEVFDDVVADLMEQLADTQVRLAEAEAEISRLQADDGGDG